jgi:TusE/DsrC/DsvC family sulfur relay protein
MALITLAGKQFDVDEDGFLLDLNQWTEDVAIGLAKTEGIEALTEDHWKVIRDLREYYKKFNVAPPIRMLCKQTGFPLKRIYELFSTGPAKGACKLAGLPKPTGCI